MANTKDLLDTEFDNDTHTESTDKKDTYEHAYLIKFSSPFIDDHGILVSANDMDRDTAKCIMKQHYPILARLFRVGYLTMG